MQKPLGHVFGLSCRREEALVSKRKKNTKMFPRTQNQKRTNLNSLTDLAHSVEVVVTLVMRAEVFAGVAKARATAEPVARVGNVPPRGARLIQGLYASAFFIN